MVSVLLVDDDENFLRLTEKILVNGGYFVASCTNGHDALDILQNEYFDIVLADAHMPIVSGFDLVKTIRKLDRNNEIAVALLSGTRDQKEVQHAIDCGAEDCILKPLDPDLFLGTMATLLKNKPPLNRPEIRFAESPVNMIARWDVTTEITRISEQGMTLWSPISAAQHSKFKINSELFQLIGLETAPLLRVVGCRQDPSHPHMFFTRVHFVGLPDSELQKIRFWINTNGFLNNKDEGKKYRE